MAPTVAFAQQTDSTKADATKTKKSIYTDPLFQGGDEKSFADWVAGQTVFPADSTAAGEPFVVYFKIDEKGKVTDVDQEFGGFTDPEFSGQIRSVIENSPNWTSKLKRRKPIDSHQLLLIDPAHRKVEAIDFDVLDENCTMPKFNGGDMGDFRNWVMGKLVYPARSQSLDEEGMVKIQFAVDKFGRVVEIKTLGSTNEYLSNEVIRIIRASPRWIPGSMNGIPIKIYCVLPVNFVLR